MKNQYRIVSCSLFPSWAFEAQVKFWWFPLFWWQMGDKHSGWLIKTNTHASKEEAKQFILEKDSCAEIVE